MGVQPNTGDDKDKKPKTPPADPPGEDDKDPKDPDGDGGDGGDGGEDPGGDDAPEFSEKQKAYIQKLRKENSSYRQRAKTLASEQSKLSEKVSKLEAGIKKALGVEDDKDADPEVLKDKLAEKDTQIVQLQSQLALTQAADEHGIPAKGRKYFATLIAEAAEELGEGEELSDEKMEEIVTEVKGLFGKPANSSVDGDGKGGGDKKPDGGKGTTTVEQFSKMSTTEKSLLYQKNPTLYAELFQQAKDKKLLV